MSDTQSQAGLVALLDDVFARFERVVGGHEARLRIEEVGRVQFVGQGITRLTGLPGARAEELLLFDGGQLGMAFNLDADEVGALLLTAGESLRAGSEVRRTGRVLDVPVGEALLGRVISPAGQPLDDGGPLRASERRPVEREAPPIINRAPVTRPLQTGLKVVDALVPIGRGQRELILGDRQTGKSAIALDTIINQKGRDVVCVYCAIGQRSSGIARLIADLRAHDALEYSVVVMAASHEPAGVQFIAPYAATSIGEYFMESGRDVLIVYDDLTRHAWAYRELSLLLRRPPGREAYPGDIFYIHSRLLERATQLREDLGGGSLTALPIAETEAQNVSAYIPTNLISITDGQVYLSPELFQKGILPAVDVGRSVSRVGGKTQLPAYRAVAGNLRLAYTQFEELETFARFGTWLDEDTRQTLKRGQRVREVLKQVQYEPMPVSEQIAVLLAVSEGVFDGVPLETVGRAERAVRKAVAAQAHQAAGRVEAGQALSDEDRQAILGPAREAVAAEAAADIGGD
jgi:F-type H+/Na+-transporting ATPase subunit alpha